MNQKVSYTGILLLTKLVSVCCLKRDWKLESTTLVLLAMFYMLTQGEPFGQPYICYADDMAQLNM